MKKLQQLQCIKSFDIASCSLLAALEVLSRRIFCTSDGKRCDRNILHMPKLHIRNKQGLLSIVRSFVFRNAKSEHKR